GPARAPPRDLTQAQATYETWIHADPAAPEPYDRLDMVLQARGALQARVDLWRRLTEQHGDWPRPHLFLGHARRGVGDLAGAVEAYRHASELAAKDPGLRLTYANALADHGDTAEAIAVLRASQNFAEHTPLLRFRLIELLCETGAVDEARQYANEWRAQGHTLPDAVAEALSAADTSH
ncbi:MAG TPA: tetratricopeptide repeat protein, partial [Candidatus Hydrogenedentes bacterium]|nr:tetratricopeptide repeat protein [Candidatus Hydrogenedentota bacterium]